MNYLKNHSLQIIVFVALLLGIFFRFYRLGQTPSGLYLDEAALGYNAFSILNTQKDEFGKTFPVLFRSFTTFQSPIYTYLLSAVLTVFDLSIFSTRLPSAIFGTLTLPLFYFLIKELSPKKYAHSLSAVSLLLLSLSPWHILFSRTAYETNIALFFLLLGIYLFVKSLSRPWIFIASSFSFAISLLAYRSEVIIVPVVVLALLIRYFKTLKSISKTAPLPLILSVLLGLFLVFPTLMLIRTPGFMSRSSALNIFGNTSFLSSIKEFLSLYTSYFSPRYLFSLGDAGPRSSYPGQATFFVWLAPFYFYGIYLLIKEKSLSHLRYLVMVLLFVSPIPAALTRDPYITIRSLPLVIPQTIIISFGLIRFLRTLPSLFNKFKYLLLSLLFLYSSVGLSLSIFYFNDYFRSFYWDYGWEQVVKKLSDLDSSLPIIVDNSRGEPYINLLFFLKYNPQSYQRDNFEVPLAEYYTNLDRNMTKNLGRITVKRFEWGTDTDKVEQYLITDSLAISDRQMVEHRLLKVDTINYPDGSVALNIFKTGFISL